MRFANSACAYSEPFYDNCVIEEGRAKLNPPHIQILVIKVLEVTKAWTKRILKVKLLYSDDRNITSYL